MGLPFNPTDVLEALVRAKQVGTFREFSGAFFGCGIVGGSQVFHYPERCIIASGGVLLLAAGFLCYAYGLIKSHR